MHERLKRVFKGPSVIESIQYPGVKMKRIDMGLKSVCTVWGGLMAIMK